jgi:DNA-directed RNA polymerase specialized sigma24 family protein
MDSFEHLGGARGGSQGGSGRGVPELCHRPLAAAAAQAFLLTGEQHAAEDLVQSTLEQVYVAWREVDAADEPEAYVRRVMINAHARKYRRRLRESVEVTR